MSSEGAQDRPWNPTSSLEALVDADLATLATALDVRVDDLLRANPEQAPPRPAVGIAPRISDAELVNLAVMQALLGHVREARWLRYATDNLTRLFPYLPQQPGYNKRLRKLTPTIIWLIRALGRDTSGWGDDGGWWTRPRWSAGGPGRLLGDRSWRDGPRTATAPATLLLGAAPAPAPAVHAARAASRLRPHRGQGRRASRPAQHPRRSSSPIRT